MLIPRRRRHWLLPHVTKFALPSPPGPIIWNPYDDFNRADGALGANWTDSVNGFLIDTNTAKPSNTTSTTVWTIAPPTANYWAEVTTPQPAIGPAGPGVAVRIITSDTFYALIAINMPAFVKLYRYVLGVPTLIQTYPYPGAGVRLRLHCANTNIHVTINGTPQAVENDGIIPGPGRAGIVCLPYGVALQPVDNFSAGY